MSDLQLVRPTKVQAPTPSKLTTIPGYELYNRPVRKAPYLVDEIVPAGSKFALTGTRGIWKSWTLTSMACCIATGTPFMGRFKVAPAAPSMGGAVLFIQLEESIDEAERKYQWILKGMGLSRD